MRAGGERWARSGARARARLVVLALALLGACAACSACNKGASAGAPGGGSSAVAALLPADAAPPERAPELDDMWARAKEGEEDDLVRLARREGVTGLIDRGAHPAYRATAARALGYTEGFAALPWLAAVGAGEGADETEATYALASAVTLATQPRKQRDPEDAEELRAGCDKLLAIAKDAQATRARRVLAVRALRMLTDYGAVKAADIPGDLDARAGAAPAGSGSAARAAAAKPEGSAR